MLRVINIPFTGRSRALVLEPGNYKFELWGASGTFNNCGHQMNKTGWGAYSSGYLTLSAKKTFYVYIGETGKVNMSTFNGNDHDFYTGTFAPKGIPIPGGGATDIRLIDSEKWTDFESLKSRIIVAGGGGGGDCFPGGDAGGLESITLTQTGTPPTVANQMNGGLAGTIGFRTGYKGEFGIGGAGMCSNNFVSCDSGGGGGGGYFGGGGTALNSGGTGGSSFISGHPGCIAISKSSSQNSIIHLANSIHYSGIVFHGTQMIAGNGKMPSPSGIPEVGHEGNGYARITKLDLAINSCNCYRFNKLTFLLLLLQDLLK